MRLFSCQKFSFTSVLLAVKVNIIHKLWIVYLPKLIIKVNFTIRTNFNHKPLNHKNNIHTKLFNMNMEEILRKQQVRNEMFFTNLMMWSAWYEHLMKMSYRLDKLIYPILEILLSCDISRKHRVRWIDRTTDSRHLKVKYL